VDVLFASMIAVAGTLLGSTTTYIFQRLTAGRAEEFARNERLRQERLVACQH
jgi:membrane protein YqaA with SNARE-associated domain